MALTQAVTYREGGGELELEIEWDDPRAAEPFDGTGDLTRFRVSNTTPRDYAVTIRRANGAVWQDRTVQPGQSFEFPPQGPVRTITDLGQIVVREV